AAGDRIHARAALGLGAEPREPRGAAVDDVGHVANRLDVVHDRRLAECALDGRERRLELRPALLALERRDQACFFTTDVWPGPSMDDDVEPLSEIARGIGVLDRRREPPPRLDVLAADVDEARRAAY